MKDGMRTEMKRDGHGRFVRKKEANAGRPKRAAQLDKIAEQTMYDILREAAGDPVKIMSLCLERGADLQLTRSEVYKLCDRLAPYRAPKKSSIDTTVDTNTNITVEYVQPKVVDMQTLLTINNEEDGDGDKTA